MALALGGGGARGFAYVGVLQVLEQAKIPVDLIVGTSAGSIVGALYADNPDAAALRTLITDVKRKNFIDFSLLHILNGPVKGDALVKFLQTHMSAGDFKDLKIRFVAVATDLRGGEVFPIDSGPVAPAVHASAALPPYFHAVKINNHTLVDGGVSAPVPVAVALKYQPRVTIAVRLDGTLSSKMPKNSLGEIARSYSITLGELGELNAAAADVVIHLDVGTAGTFDFADKEALFKAGVEAATKALPRIRALLEEKQIK